MGAKLYCVLFWFIVMSPSLLANLDFESDAHEDRWIFRHTKDQEDEGAHCMKIKPTPKDIVKRFCAIIPYFDKEHSNTAFLHKFRGTIYSMADGEDILDREAAFYATIIVPMIFLQQHRDTWCLLERFHRTIRLYQISHPTEKRLALKLLQNLRSVSLKIRKFIYELPGSIAVTRTTPPPEPEDVGIYDKKDIRYLKELIKNLG